MYKLSFSACMLLVTIAAYVIIGGTDFDKLKKRHPYWLIFALLFLLMAYPLVENTLSNSCNTDYKDLGQFLFNYKDYFGTIISVMIAIIAYISENAKKEKS